MVGKCATLLRRQSALRLKVAGLIAVVASCLVSIVLLLLLSSPLRGWSRIRSVVIVRTAFRSSRNLRALQLGLVVASDVYKIIQFGIIIRAQRLQL